MAAGTQLSIFEGNTKQLPAAFADINEQGNIVERSQVNQLSFRGKNWRTVIDGKEEVIKNAEGDPVPTVSVIILAYNNKRSRAYYAGYVDGQSKPPICWSRDGDKPDDDVPPSQRQNASCAQCKQSVKGSRITEAGKESTACAQFKKAVVVPAANLAYPPLVMKLPQTSLWDKDNAEYEAANFFAFDQYLDFLKRNGVNHTALVVTKMKFDARTSYPKLLFNPVAWTPTAAEAEVRAHLAAKDKIDALLNTVHVAAAETAPAPEEFEQVVATAAAPAAAPAPAPAAATPAPAAAAPASAAAAKPAPRPRPVAATPAPAAAKPAAPIEGESTKVSEAPAASNAGLATLMSEWDD